jgi:hypothetical protein
MTGEVALVLLKRFWWSIPIAILLVLLLVTRVQRDHARADLQASLKLNGRLTEQLEITAASLNGALARIDDSNRRILAAAAQLDQAKQRAAADQARADERWKGSGRTVAALEASAKAETGDPCTVSDAAAQALEGL